MSAPFETAPTLAAAGRGERGPAHGFFSRAGGVSQGVYASLNCGPGSDDDPADIEENRRRAAIAIGAAPDRLVTAHQVHSARAVIIERPFAGPPEKADAMATRAPGLALGVLAADCMPWLFCDAQAGVIAAAHAGWRGALAGVLESAIEAMATLGARPERIIAAVGPCLRQPQFEVGPELIDAFTRKHQHAARFFTPAPKAGKYLLDLIGFAKDRLNALRVTRIDDIDRCTLARPDRYFSYRAMRRRGERDYGRNLAMITLG